MKRKVINFIHIEYYFLCVGEGKIQRNVSLEKSLA